MVIYCMSVGYVNVFYLPNIPDQFNEDFKDFLNKLVVDLDTVAAHVHVYVLHSTKFLRTLNFGDFTKFYFQLNLIKHVLTCT